MADVYFTTPDTGYVVGTGGTILQTTNGVTVGIKEPNLDEQMKIYPNPASDIITLEIDKGNNTDLTLKIYNLLGILVKSEIVKQSKQQININDLSNGIYMVEIREKELTRKQKIIIQR